jgi:anti-sigma-K factor RskA
MSSNSSHIEDQELDLLALGALEGEDLRVVQCHLAECADCSRRMTEARRRIALLAFAAPQEMPSASARASLMVRVRAGAASVPFSAAPAATRAESPAKTRHKGLAETWPSTRRGWPLGWATLALGLAVAALLLWVNNGRLDRELQALRQNTAQLQGKEIQNQHLLELFTASDTIQVSLAPMPGHPGAPARVQYNQRRGLLVYAGAMPALPSDHCYELWLIPTAGDPINAGIFHPNTAGRATVMMPPLPAGVVPKAFAVTIEPEGGVSKPTGAMVQLGAVS